MCIIHGIQQTEYSMNFLLCVIPEGLAYDKSGRLTNKDNKATKRTRIEVRLLVKVSSKQLNMMSIFLSQMIHKTERKKMI